jgi:hypothetical protein
MRLGMLVLAIGLMGVTAGSAPASGTHVLAANGVSFITPTSWHDAGPIVLADCNPSQAIAITNVRRPISRRGTVVKHAALIVVLDDQVNNASGFPRRTLFRLPAKPELMGGCCAMPVGLGYGFDFREHGRHFQAFVYSRTRANAARAVAILNTLVVDPTAGRRA